MIDTSDFGFSCPPSWRAFSCAVEWAAMESLQVGDWVRTKSGEVGQVVAMAKLSAFVKIPDGPTETVGHLLSELTKIAPPEPENKPAH
jgi:hypothetical protein